LYKLKRNENFVFNSEDGLAYNLVATGWHSCL